jgi:hypothetical protein
MRRKVIGILALVVCSFLFAVPASAVTLPECGTPTPNLDGTNDFTLVGKDNIIFEGGSPSGGTINGNVLVTNPIVTQLGASTGTGFVKLGPNVTINGTVTAHTILLPSNGTSQIQKCVADVIVGPGCAATGGAGAFTAFAAANAACVNQPTFASLCLDPAPTVNPCVNGKAPLSIPVGFANPLDYGCYGALTVEQGAVLQLKPASGGGVYTFKTIRLKSGARLESSVANDFATVNVNADFITDPGVLITDIHLNAATVAPPIGIFNNDILTRVIINGPFGKVHLHTGTQLNGCSEACGRFLDVEPITTECTPPENEFCACPAGFVFNVDPVQPFTPANQVSRLCVRPN